MTLEQMLRKREYRVGLLAGGLTYLLLACFSHFGITFIIGLSIGCNLIATGICYFIGDES